MRFLLLFILFIGAAATLSGPARAMCEGLADLPEETPKVSSWETAFNSLFDNYQANPSEENLNAFIKEMYRQTWKQLKKRYHSRDLDEIEDFVQQVVWKFTEKLLANKIKHEPGRNPHKYFKTILSRVNSSSRQSEAEDSKLTLSVVEGSAEPEDLKRIRIVAIDKAPTGLDLVVGREEVQALRRLLLSQYRRATDSHRPILRLELSGEEPAKISELTQKDIGLQRAAIYRFKLAINRRLKRAGAPRIEERVSLNGALADEESLRSMRIYDLKRSKQLREASLEEFHKRPPTERIVLSLYLNGESLATIIRETGEPAETVRNITGNFEVDYWSNLRNRYVRYGRSIHDGSRIILRRLQSTERPRPAALFRETPIDSSGNPASKGALAEVRKSRDTLAADSLFAQKDPSAFLRVVHEESESFPEELRREAEGAAFWLRPVPKPIGGAKARREDLIAEIVRRGVVADPVTLARALAQATRTLKLEDQGLVNRLYQNESTAKIGDDFQVARNAIDKRFIRLNARLADSVVAGFLPSQRPTVGGSLTRRDSFLATLERYGLRKDRDEVVTALAIAIETLPDEDKEIAKLSFSGAKIAQIGERKGQHYNTILRRVGRIEGALIKALQEEGLVAIPEKVKKSSELLTLSDEWLTANLIREVPWTEVQDTVFAAVSGLGKPYQQLTKSMWEGTPFSGIGFRTTQQIRLAKTKIRQTVHAALAARKWLTPYTIYGDASGGKGPRVTLQKKLQTQFPGQTLDSFASDLEAAIARESENYREPLQLILMEGKDLRTVANRTNVNKDALRAKLSNFGNAWVASLVKKQASAP